MFEDNKPIPPFVLYEQRSVEDRAASMEAGHYVARDVDYVVIIPRGGKDRVEKVYETWIKEQENLSRDGRVPMEWVQQYKAAYKAWKAGQALPEEGTPLKAWPVASPAQVAQCLSLGITTVEQLAQCTTEAVQRMGMGGLTLKERATKWLKDSQDQGKMLMALERATSENDMLRTRNEELEARLAALEAKLDVQSPVQKEAPSQGFNVTI